MAKKFYAVKSGRTPGIYETWSDCEKQVKGFGGAIYKLFPTKSEAQAFIGDEGMSIGDYLASSKTSKTNHTKKSIAPDFSETNHLIAYIDGSYDKYNQSVGSGGIMFLNGNKETFSFGTKDVKYTEFWNVFGLFAEEQTAAAAAAAFRQETDAAVHLTRTAGRYEERDRGN